jgi:hypothetical protein
MKNRLAQLLAIVIVLHALSGGTRLSATPSTIIWIPSTDFQAYGTWHLGIDNYFSVFKKGPASGGVAFPTDLGLTYGVYASPLLQVEAGVDMLEPQDSPWLFNGKIGTPENSLFDGSPSLAIGTMNVGVEKNLTDYNIFYILTAKNIGTLGRVTVGYFSGNGNLLVNPESGARDRAGAVASWDRQMNEISDKLWLAVDYQSGHSAFGTVNAGIGWSFTDKIAVIAGYDVYHNGSPATVTTQLDVTF